MCVVGMLVAEDQEIVLSLGDAQSAAPDTRERLEG
jgi:hypothetical protein